MSIVEVGSFEAKNQLARLLRLVEKGQRVYITRHGRRVAVLLRPEDADFLDSRRIEPRELLEQFRRFRSEGRPGPESLRELIEEGRRR